MVAVVHPGAGVVVLQGEGEVGGEGAQEGGVVGVEGGEDWEVVGAGEVGEGLDGVADGGGAGEG
ncbi:hypothetical protein DR950_00015 [Kitasatospora xanthocidica]|uniref:Uncharacterized protein n=1 Tax=Kitasatospora xanthocidica TaxID=83382 RepID=A0A372ZKP1_9ACTN|nr:hypothetical protein DR950_00015 [Kitasatospora xanthocidica]